MVSDAAPLRALCTPLGPRLGLIQVRSATEWEQLARALPQVVHQPGYRTGTLIGLVCWAGTPVDGRWPVHIDRIRAQDGAVHLHADFRPGTYLPDGTARLETAHLGGSATVLAVDVNGTTFFPDETAD